MNINLFLKHAGANIIFMGTLLFLAAHTPVFAQNPAAMPVPTVEEETIAPPENGMIIVELFSSQACAFCPKADRLFADILAQDNIIGLACHVDYFDVKEGSLSHPFCTERQSWYMDKLDAGPNYTPQMVINGVTDVVGYKLEALTTALQQADYANIPPIKITKNEGVSRYNASIPMNNLKDLEDPKNLKLWVMVYDKPHNLTISGGANKGKTATYYNIIDSINTIDTITEEMSLTPTLTAQHAGFAVLLQDDTNGKIFAAGNYVIQADKSLQPALEKE